MPVVHDIRRLRAGDEGEWRGLYDAALPVLWAFVRARTHGVEDAQERVAEVWLAAVDGFARFDPGRGTVLGYVMGIAKNILAAKRRETARIGARPLLEAEDHPVAQQNGDLSRIALVEAALAGLPQKERSLLTWRHVEKVPLVEIGERLGVTAKAVERRLARARDLLRDGFQKLQAEEEA
jgi:RNA polymerase sigma-70 factor (ECF subfamily)